MKYNFAFQYVLLYFHHVQELKLEILHQKKEVYCWYSFLKLLLHVYNFVQAHKLEVLRQKKQEYLEYQRQLTLQRMEEQKREMQMRLAHQKQMQMQRAMQYGMVSLPQVITES